jgi:hypothetical protein
MPGRLNFYIGFCATLSIQRLSFLFSVIGSGISQTWPHPPRINNFQAFPRCVDNTLTKAVPLNTMPDRRTRCYSWYHSVDWLS